MVFEEENLICLDGVICNLTVMWILADPDLGDDVGYFSAAVAPFFKIRGIAQLTKNKSNKSLLLIA